MDRAMNTMASVVYDAVIVPGGEQCVAALAADGFAVHFVAEAVKHAKAVGAVGAGVTVLARVADGVAELAGDAAVVSDQGVVTSAATDGAPPDGFVDAFVTALGQHRAWERDTGRGPRLTE